MLLILGYVWRKCTGSRAPYRPTTSPYRPTALPYQPTASPYQPPTLPYRLPTSPYQCRYCDSTDLEYRVVKPGNRLGNDGRPYYVCVNPDCPKVRNLDGHDRGWVTWDDNIGVDPRNPQCKCGRSSREDVANAGYHFWTCSTGRCDFGGRIPGT